MKQLLELIIILFKRYRIIILYLIIGGTGAAIDFLLFIALTSYFHFTYTLANVISVSAGITNNFILNSFFNYKVKDRMFTRFLMFYGVGIVGLGISTLMLFVFIEILSFPVILSKVLTILIIPLIQCYLNTRFTFKKGVVKNGVPVNSYASLQRRGKYKNSN